jgi:hypothetical protein
MSIEGQKNLSPATNKIKPKPLRKEKTMRIKTIIYVCVTLLCTSILNSLWIANDNECVFTGQCEITVNGQSIPTDESTLNVSLVKMLIRDAAVKFLDSSSDFQKFLKFCEYNGISTTSFYIETAKAKIFMAKNIYQDLFNTVKEMEYNEAIINAIKVFDYDKFAIEKGLNISIFDKMKGYFRQGNVKGAFEYLALKSDGIYQMLINFSGDKSELWRIYQEYSEFQLFGQYMTEVIMEVKKE